MTDLGYGRVTWTCMICGRERDDQDIAVATESAEIPAGRGGQMSFSVRHCVDSSSCAQGAREQAETWVNAMETKEGERGGQHGNKD